MAEKVTDSPLDSISEKEKAFVLLQKLSNDLVVCYDAWQEGCRKVHSKGRSHSSARCQYYDYAALRKAKVIQMKFNKLRMKFNIPCIRTGSRYRYVFKPILILS